MEVPSLRLDGKAALITGAGRGIGLAIARALAGAGCAVAIQDIDEAVAIEEAARIRGEGGKAVALGGDVGEDAVMRRLVSDAASQLGSLHILVNNAAIQRETYWIDEQPAEMLRQWRVNMLAPIVLAQQAVPLFRAQRYGRILNLGSVQQDRGSSHMLPYAMSKGALLTFTRTLAYELARDGITVNLIAPGFFNTWRNREALGSPEKLAQGAKWVPMGRVGEPRDVAGIALLLCGEAGSYITGDCIYVDGGISAR